MRRYGRPGYRSGTNCAFPVDRESSFFFIVSLRLEKYRSIFRYLLYDTSTIVLSIVCSLFVGIDRVFHGTLSFVVKFCQHIGFLFLILISVKSCAEFFFTFLIVPLYRIFAGFTFNPLLFTFFRMERFLLRFRIFLPSDDPVTIHLNERDHRMILSRTNRLLIFYFLLRIKKLAYIGALFRCQMTTL